MAIVAIGAVALAHGAVSARPTGAEVLAGTAGRQELPVSAAGPVSRILGRYEPGYLVVRSDGAFVARNRTQRLAARFSASGVVLRSGRLSVAMRLRGYGYGAHVIRVAAKTPSARANQVIYRNGPLTQWYANGPLGLEQGYTLAMPPTRPEARACGGWLVFALRVSGGARMAVAHGIVVFSRKGESLAYRGLVATDALGRRLPARVTVAKRGVLLWVDDAGARYPVRVDPLFQQQAKLTGSDSGAFDGLGFSVAVSGRTVVAGAPFAAVGPNANQGAVYVFTEAAGGWANETQAAKLTASDGAASDELGSSVAVSGGTVVAGAPGAAIGGKPSQGAAYVFTEPVTGWANETQAAKLTASDGAANDILGTSVAVSGGTAVAGTPGAAIAVRCRPPGLGSAWAGSPTSCPPNFAQGAVYVFTEPVTGWANETQAAKLTAADGAPDSDLGDSVAISGGTVVAGAPLATIGSNENQGAVYVFIEPVTGWADETQAAKLTASDGAAFDRLGRSVAVEGGTVVAGAPLPFKVNTGPGAAYVFTEPGTGWADETQAAKLTASDGVNGDHFGQSVALSGQTVVVGAVAAAVGSNALQGAAYVFTEPGTGWADETQAAKLTAADGAANDILGASVAVSGSTVVAGAPGAAVATGGAVKAGPPMARQGAAYVFGPPVSTPPGGGYPGVGYLVRFLSPRPGSRWPAGSTVPVTAVVDFGFGSAIPGWLASDVAAHCGLTIEARGVQRLRTHCMRYDSATRRFVYEWQLGSAPAGRATLQAQLSFLSVTSASEQIAVGASGH